MESKLLTVAEAAAMKSVTRSAVYRAIAEGRLPHQRVLGHVAIRKRDVESWLPVHHAGRPKGRPMSDEAKLRISQSQKHRWAQRKQQL